MKRHRRTVLFALSLALATRSVVACKADGAGDPAPSSEATSDASADAGSPEAKDAANDAAPDRATPVPICSVDGWCYSTLPAAGTFDAGSIPLSPDGIVFALQAVWVAPDHHAWAVSSAGHVLQWDGTSWKLELVARAGLRSVWGTSATDVWLAGDAGLLLHGTGSAGALTFAPVSVGTAQSLSRVWGTSPSDIWVLSDRVYHLDADTAATSTSFAVVDIPSDYGAAVASQRVTAVWGTASETWFGGAESSFCAPPNCTTSNQRFVAKRSVLAGVVSWSTIPLPIDATAGVAAGLSTTDGLQVVTLKGDPLWHTGIVARIADDASKLDKKRGAIVVNGNHAWNFELAEAYGLPAGMWGRDAKDLWLVGESGVVRHFDGVAWQISRVARTPLAPLVNDLRGIDAVVDAMGERDMWIVGDDVALHRTVKP